MKLAILLITVACLQVSARTVAQSISLSKTNAPLTDVFNSIQQQSHYQFFWKGDDLSAYKVSINLKNANIGEVMDKLLKDLPLTYTISENTVVIQQKDPSFLDKLKARVKAELAQTTITGQVVDGTGQPMSGVTVREKGLQNAIATDAKGKFALSVTDNNTVITFSYIGYETQELQAKYIAAGSVITLKAAENNLQEVVIKKGYYDEKRALSTGDVSVVTGKEINEQPVTDVMQAMEGQVPGLYISQASGVPGAYGKINIMGQNSLANGSDPLYVIDGVPYSSVSMTNTNIGGGVLGEPTPSFTFNSGGGMSPFSLLNPADIEDIQVLKDADATAIYGSQGANGVILITTKKGQAGDTKIDVNISQGDGQVTRMIPMLNTQQYLQVRHQAFTNDGTTPSLADGDFDLLFWDTTRNTNWQKVLIGNTAHYTNANFDISGGNANTQFILGGTFNRQGTVYAGDYSDRKAAGFLNLTHNSADQKFTVMFTLNYTYDDSNLPSTDFTSTALTLAPDAPALYNKDGSLNWAPYNGTFTIFNPLGATLDNANAQTDNLVTNLSLAYKILPGLQFKSNFGYNTQAVTQTNIQTAASYPPPYNTMASFRSNSSANNSSTTWNIEPQLSYSTRIDKGQLSALLGTTFQENTLTELADLGSGYGSDAQIPNIEAASNQSFYNYNSEYKYNAVYGRLGYTWDDKYLLNITARRDGSSRFGTDRQWADFGAIGAGWVFSKEKFIENALPWLSFGKLRGSFGITGNDQIGNYKYLSAYNTSSPTYQNITTLNPAGLTNPYYSWEKVKKTEAGVDLGFLKDRIDLTATYYYNLSSNQLQGYTLPAITGFGSILENLPATIENSGWEFTLNTQNIVSKDFKWTSSFNLTLPQNKLLAYPNLENSSLKYSYAIRQSIFSHFVYNYTGINPQTGLYAFAGETNGTLSPSNYIVGQPTTPSAYGGFSNRFSYKGFQLDIMFQFVKQLGYNYLRYWSAIGAQAYNEPVYAIQPGNTYSTTQFTANTGQAFHAYSYLQNSNAAITDASFIRLKNLALSYSLPTDWVKNIGMRNAKIYLQGQNLLTFTGYKGLDPETQGMSLPPVRMISLGVQAGF